MFYLTKIVKITKRKKPYVLTAIIEAENEKKLDEIVRKRFKGKDYVYIILE